MQRIEYVEEPLVEGLLAAGFSVVEKDKYDRDQNDTQLEHRQPSILIHERGHENRQSSFHHRHDAK